MIFIPRLIDVMHLGNDRVIGAWLRDGVIVDPGPASCLDALLDGLDGHEPRVLLLTHIHLDHAGASGSLVRRFPKLRVYVHEVGAPHLADPSKLLASAARLYGDDMKRLWGEVVPVPDRNLVPLSGGEQVEGLRVAYAPGHASHHVVYFDESAGDAYVGDVAGVRVPPADDLVVMPTPPPDIDLEAWERSLELVGGLCPQRLRLTHFGAVEAVDAHLERAREALRRSAERARGGDRSAFLAAVEAETGRAGDAVSARLTQAAPPEQLWLGLDRYWTKRGTGP